MGGEITQRAGAEAITEREIEFTQVVRDAPQHLAVAQAL
jgi:hypothetical protein